MGRVLLMTVEYEGGFFSPQKNQHHPIRIYSDRWVEDDIAAKFTGSKKRQRLSRKQFRIAKRAARSNAVRGLV
jgi:hypothetical protein